MNLVDITFAHGASARAARIQRLADLPEALQALDVPRPRRTLVLVGGAGGMDESTHALVRPLFDEALAPLVDGLGASVVDGGTDFGVMRLMGQARARGQYSFPLVGVAVERLVTWPGGPQDEHRVSLEPHHSQFMLIRHISQSGGPIWLSEVGALLCGHLPSVTVLINGGVVAYDEVIQSVKDRRPVIVVGGSGRLADRLAYAIRHGSSDRQLRELAASGRLRLADLADGGNRLREVVAQIFLAKE